MKTLIHTPRSHVARLIMSLLFSMITLFTFAQPDYDFRNPVLLSGTNLAVNARYRFSNVAAGTDAIVKIVAFSGGASLNQIDGPTGYVEAFQPVINIAAKSNG